MSRRRPAGRLGAAPGAFALALALSMLAGGAARAAEHLTLALDWLVNPDQAPVFVAEQIGAFSRRGLAVTWIAPSDAASPPLMVATGQADIAITYQPQLYLLHDQGVPVVRVGALVDQPLNSIIALRGGPVRSLADLDGRRLGYAVPGVEEALARTMLTSAHVNPARVRLVAVNFQIVSALMTGRVDATISAYRNKEIHELAEHGFKAVAFYPEAYGVPPYEELIFVARRDRLSDPGLPRFLGAVAEGADYLRRHPEECWRAFARAHPDQDTPLVHMEWTDTAARFALSPARLDTAKYARFGAYLAAAGLIRRAPRPEEIAVQIEGAR